MKELKSKIVTLRYFKFVFYLIFLFGTICFLITSASNSENIVRNGFISIILMLFGLTMSEVLKRYIAVYLKEFKRLKNARKTVKVIEFEKIA